MEMTFRSQAYPVSLNKQQQNGSIEYPIALANTETEQVQEPARQTPTRLLSSAHVRCQFQSVYIFRLKGTMAPSWDPARQPQLDRAGQDGEELGLRQLHLLVQNPGSSTPPTSPRPSGGT